MDHPNIAGIFDAGTTDGGLPYFVMEYVPGRAVTTFVAERHLSIRQRLELFLKICTGVEAAHRRRIVHRDLKPGNILVNEDGEPKLLDFGIAKLLATDSTLEKQPRVNSASLRSAIHPSRPWATRSPLRAISTRSGPYSMKCSRGRRRIAFPIGTHHRRKSRE
jgi:serine/threonine protein kinase